MAISKGDKAPLFTLKNQDGEDIVLSDYIGTHPVVIYFYPKNFTPGCIAEACSFRDNYAEFMNLGATIFGVSNDTVNSHKRFVKRYQLPFAMLSDTKNTVRKKYGVKGELLGLIPGRETFVIDKDGVIQMRFDSIQAKKHIIEALQIVKQISYE